MTKVSFSIFSQLLFFKQNFCKIDLSLYRIVTGSVSLSAQLAYIPQPKVKDEYDLEYDKGRVKKVRKKTDQFKNMKNQFQAIENSGRTR